MTRDEIRQRIGRVEESYEYFLAYAAQGLSGEGAERKSGEARNFLERADEALDGLSRGCTDLIEREALTPQEPYWSMISVLDRDISSTRAAIQLVMAQPIISSQLIDNLNASIHVRALLTDLFLLDEVFKHQGTTDS